MTAPVTAIVTELVAAGLGGDALVAAIARLEAAGVFAGQGAAAAVRRGRPGDSDSDGARRTRAWRARQAQRPAVTPVTAFVTPPAHAEPAQVPENAGPVVPIIGAVASQTAPDAGIVTVVAEKEKPPHPHKKNYPPKPPGRTRRHKPAFGATPIVEPDRIKTRVPGDTALHFELVALSRQSDPGRVIPDTGANGWYWTRAEIAAAEASMSSRVVSLAPRRAGDGGEVRAREARR